MIRRIALATVAVTAAALTSSITWSAAADAAPAVAAAPPVDHAYSIPLGIVTNMVVDPSNGLIFYSGRPGSAGRAGGVAVSKLDGTGMALLDGTTSAAFVTLGPDGKVYASEDSNNLIVIDPTLATPAVIDTFSTGAARCPSDIAFAGTDLWFGYNCGGDNNLEAGIATLNPADGTVTTALAHWQFETVHIVALPGTSDTLIADELSGGWDVDRVTVSGTTATVAQHASMTVTGNGPMTISPDGSIVVDKGATYNAADLSPSSITYSNPSAWSPMRLAFSSDGKHVGSAAYGAVYTSDLLTFTAAGAVVHDRHNAQANGPGDAVKVTNSGLAWVGDVLLAVYGDPWAEYPTLLVENTALQAPTAMTFTAAKSVPRAKRLVLSGVVTGAANAQITMTKRDPSGVHALGYATTDSLGRYSFADVPAVGGANTYLARFEGDETHAPVTRAVAVSVLRATVPMSLRLDRSIYNYRQVAHLSVHLASHDVKKVQVWIKSGYNPLHYQQTLTVDRKGNAGANYVMGVNTIFVLKFYGDYYYNSRVLTMTVRTHVAIASALGGQYATSGAYKLFHPGTKAYQVAVVAPAKEGACVRFEAQRYVNGTWTTSAVLTCGVIQDNYAEAVFGAGAGLPYRLRAIYNGDAVNLGNVTAWQYLIFR